MGVYGETVIYPFHAIPGRCTGKIQPLDVHFSQQYKSFIRYVTDTFVIESDVKIWQRDQFLALQSFGIYQEWHGMDV